MNVYNKGYKDGYEDVCEKIIEILQTLRDSANKAVKKTYEYVKEDYEEPKEYWFIDFNGEVKEFELLGFEWQGWMKEIGNYFNTPEEAEGAVEKLKAFKRLKDKEFRFLGIRKESFNACDGVIKFTVSNIPICVEDLDLLFGGEE